MFKFEGKRPDNLGVNDGQLAACPSSPNCVSSQAPAADSEHAIAPLPFVTIDKIREVVEGMERATVVEADENYLYAEFRSQLMGFVDDVEFYRDAANQTLHVRSASRLGQSDLGVNRKRVEAIRAQLS